MLQVDVGEPTNLALSSQQLAWAEHVREKSAVGAT